MAVEMAQQVRVLAAKPGRLSPSPKSYIVEGKNQLPQAVLGPTPRPRLLNDNTI